MNDPISEVSGVGLLYVPSAADERAADKLQAHVKGTDLRGVRDRDPGARHPWLNTDTELRGEVAITAKVICTRKDNYGEGDDRTAQLTFGPDYQAGANAEWASATPSLNLTMTVRGTVADRFDAGQQFTLTFERNDPGQ